MATEKAADASGAPANAKVILVTLIVVAAVANLPLAMANVALPTIGAYFDASQDAAESRRRGLFARTGVLGALAGRTGRPLRPQADGASRRDAGDTCRADQRLCADDRDLDLRTSLRRFCGGHGLPDHPRLDCGVVGSRGAAHTLDRAVGGHRRRDLGVWPAAVRDPVCRSPPLGLGLLDRHPAGGGGTRSWR